MGRPSILDETLASVNLKRIDEELHPTNRFKHRYELICLECGETFWRVAKALQKAKIKGCYLCHEKLHSKTAGRISAAQAQRQVTYKYPNLLITNINAWLGIETELQLQCKKHPQMYIQSRKIYELKKNIHNPCYLCGSRKTQSLQEVKLSIQQKWRNLELIEYSGYFKKNFFRCVKHGTTMSMTLKNFWLRKSNPCVQCSKPHLFEKVDMPTIQDHFYCQSCRMRKPLQKKVLLRNKNNHIYYRCQDCLDRAKLRADRKD